ncbi:MULTISPECIES: tetratricopeptide repeat protein [unclassified Duganella]|uniref:tetratricopeptide repeat protein n=1 Tax=unclassified Duganella TaxID=2636909 RepID=UPI000882E4AD|nr:MULTISPECIES: tetratricopeptide repeat protein [unclassified Duganella]SDG17013.1 Tfp pilus assembly protein PilF [Duganella sp. OV458]SDJ30890.1 Tfp pilus assembly protein PilF [Duganella sp. OV510]
MTQQADKLAQAIDLHTRGELDAAAALYLQIVRAEPHNFDALHMLGVYSLQTGDLPSAHRLMTQALRINANDVLAQVHHAAVLQKLGRLDEALVAIRQALRLAPDHALALNNGAALLSSDLKRPAEALPLLEHALRLNDNDATAWNGMGYALVELRRYDDALLCLERALQLQPDLALALYNQGNALQFLNRLDEAMLSYDAALALAPDMADAHFAQSACRLLMGDLAQGFQQYEWRRRRPAYQAQARQSTQAPWQGEALQGKTLLVYAEQGLGDTVQMVRYVPLLVAQGAQVILQVQEALLPLLQGTDGATVIGAQQAAPPHDLHIPLMSLPAALGTHLDNLPASAHYVQADATRGAQWQARLGPNSARRIGLAWAGNPKHDNDSQRSIPLRQISQLLQPGLEFISLQRDLSAADRLQLARLPALHSHAAAQTDFAETAALLAQLDLVICVDTSVAHLAGAMGKQVWLLLPYAPDWRWMLECQDSPWYPTMRLFRQQRPGDWDEVLQRVQAALAE